MLLIMPLLCMWVTYLLIASARGAVGSESAGSLILLSDRCSRPALM